MRVVNHIFIAFILGIGMTASLAASPVGYWKTVDDVTGQTKSIVKIEEANNVVSGTVSKLLLHPERKCDKCTGENKDKPVLGMRVMQHLVASKDVANQWQGGEILDPNNGKTYHCNIQLVENGQKMIVRGYIGVPLFGRSQTWVRVDEPKSS